MTYFDVETILRVGTFGCFIGHGWIAAWKLEFGGWSKFMLAAGFHENEAHIIMPIIGWMDITLAFIILLRPNQYCTAWMVIWALSTALVGCIPIQYHFLFLFLRLCYYHLTVDYSILFYIYILFFMVFQKIRPFSAGSDRWKKPMSDNALWGFVERASNWACPLALLSLITQDEYVVKDIIGITPLFEALAPLDDAFSGKNSKELAIFMAITFAFPWFVVIPVLRSRGEQGKPKKK